MSEYTVTTLRNFAEVGQAPNQRGFAPGKVTRRTVATLDEAREAAKDIIIDGPVRYGVDEHIIATYRLPESGGTVGPLPDGTIIEVAKVLR